MVRLGAGLVYVQELRLAVYSVDIRTFKKYFMIRLGNVWELSFLFFLHSGLCTCYLCLFLELWHFTCQFEVMTQSGQERCRLAWWHMQEALPSLCSCPCSTVQVAQQPQCELLAMTYSEASLLDFHKQSTVVTLSCSMVQNTFTQVRVPSLSHSTSSTWSRWISVSWVIVSATSKTTPITDCVCQCMYMLCMPENVY